MTEAVCPECGYRNEWGVQYCDDCGALLESLDHTEETKDAILAPRCGDVIEDRYEIVKIFSNNETTSTFLALDQKNDDLMVWIKQKVETEENEGDFEKQKAIMKTLMEKENDNLVRVLDFFKVEDKVYSVFESLDGQDLKTLMQTKGSEIDEQHILHIAIQAAEGLKQLHDLKILHRDIQPSHLFITDKGVVKLIGFGRLCSANDLPNDNAVTEGFSPPEFFGLMGGKISEASDIFSLGATLYYLATNSEPKHFSRENSFNFQPIEEADRKISDKMEEIILKAVRKDPSERFASAWEMLKKLMEIQRMQIEETENRRKKLKLDIFAKTHIGMVRTTNQDSCFVGTNSIYEKSINSEYTLLIVADGMGGVAEGDKASSLAIRVISREVLEGYIPVITGADTVRLFSEEDLQDKAAYIVKRAIEKANKIVYDYSRQDVSRRGMGSTLTVALIEKDNMCLCHAGDTRAYLYNSTEGLVKLTEDHSLVGRLVKMGQLTWEEARNSPQRSAVYRALGTSPELEVDVYQRDLKVGDVVILCSDGVWEYYPDQELSQIIETYKNPRDIGELLIKKCLERGADDNATLIVVKVMNGEPERYSEEKQEKKKEERKDENRPNTKTE